MLWLRKVYALLHWVFHVCHRLWWAKLSFFWVVKVLGGVVHQVGRRNLAGCLVGKVKVFVKRATGWPYSWSNSWRLSLFLNGLQHLPSLGVELSKWVDLLCRSMLHILAIDCWSNCNVSINDHLLRIGIDFMRLLWSFSLACFYLLPSSCLGVYLHFLNLRLLAKNRLHLIFVLLSEDTCSFLPFRNQVVRSC